MRFYRQGLIKNARVLRKNMTAEERLLWYGFLKKLPITVKRQQCIGDYIVDFYIAGRKIVIEVDGQQHGEIRHLEADAARDAVLNEMGIEVLRYSNRDVNVNFEGVVQDILQKCGLVEDDVRW